MYGCVQYLWYIFLNPFISDRTTVVFKAHKACNAWIKQRHTSINAFHPGSERRKEKGMKGGLGNKGQAVIEAKQGPPIQKILIIKLNLTHTSKNGTNVEMLEPAHPLDISLHRS